MSHKYKALTHGTLNHPYRFVEKGEIVDLPEPIQAAWLMPLEEALKLKPLPITSAMNLTKMDGLRALDNPHSGVPIVPSNPAYESQMAAIRERHAAEDAGLSSLGKHIVNDTGGEGTGNKEVLD